MLEKEEKAIYSIWFDIRRMGNVLNKMKINVFRLFIKYVGKFEYHQQRRIQGPVKHHLSNFYQKS